MACYGDSLTFFFYLAYTEKNGYFRRLVGCFCVQVLCNYTVLVQNLCGLVVRVPGCRPRGPGFDIGATTSSEQQWVWNGVHSALVSINEELLGRKVAASV
jgi:hypothetical protein